MDWVPDSYPPFDPGGVDFVDSSFESSSLMGGIDGFAFHLAGGRAEDGDGAGQLGCWDGGAVCCCGGGGGGGGGGSILGARKMGGYGGGGGPCAGNNNPNIGAGCRNKRRCGNTYVIPCNRFSNS